MNTFKKKIYGPEQPDRPKEDQSAYSESFKKKEFSEYTKEKSQEGYTGVTRAISLDEEDTLVMQEQSAKKSPASLLLLNGPKEMVGLSWPLTKEITSAGRSRRLNEIPVAHNSFSKNHFQVLREKEKFYLVDLKSTNKTYINDKPAEPFKKILLKNNDYIRASSLIFKFLDQGNIEFFSSMQTLSKAQTDPLTGAGSRALLKAKANEYFTSYKELSLIVFDIDDFKKINDSLGHSAGDYVLKKLSKRILEAIRDGDMFIRYGGDEFCIFTPKGLSAAKSIAGRIKQTLKEKDFIFKDQKIQVSLSLGLSQKEPQDKTWRDIYERADKMSYEEKNKKKKS